MIAGAGRRRGTMQHLIPARSGSPAAAGDCERPWRRWMMMMMMMTADDEEVDEHEEAGIKVVEGNEGDVMQKVVMMKPLGAR